MLPQFLCRFTFLLNEALFSHRFRVGCIIFYCDAPIIPWNAQRRSSFPSFRPPSATLACLLQCIALEQTMNTSLKVPQASFIIGHPEVQAGERGKHGCRSEHKGCGW